VQVYVIPAGIVDADELFVIEPIESPPLGLHPMAASNSAMPKYAVKTLLM